MMELGKAFNVFSSMLDDEETQNALTSGSTTYLRLWKHAIFDTLGHLKHFGSNVITGEGYDVEVYEFIIPSDGEFVHNNPLCEVFLGTEKIDEVEMEPYFLVGMTNLWIASFSSLWQRPQHGKITAQFGNELAEQTTEKTDVFGIT